MKVLQINTCFQIGSTGKLVEQLMKTQQEYGIDAYVMYGRSYGGEEQFEKVIKINTKMGFLIHKFKFHLLGKQCFYSKKETQKAINIINEIKPDIIHLHNVHTYYLNIVILFNYISKNNIPVVWTFHDCWPFTGHCTYFHTILCDKWKTGCYRCPQRMAGPRSLIFDRSKESYRDKKKLFTNLQNIQIITVSDWLKGLVKESFFKNTSTMTIYNWIDRNIFNETKKDELFRIKYDINNKFIILGVAPAWVKRKGIDDFITLAGMISEDEIIVLVGDTLANKFFGEKPVKNLPENIIIIPPTKNANELASIYAAADVFVNPSRQETFGLTTAEAMSCGTPAIVYDTTACPEVLGQDGNCGYIAKAYDVNDLYLKIKKVKDNGKNYYSKNAIKRVTDLFDKTINLNNYIQLYKEIDFNKNKNNIKEDNNDKK